MLIEAPDFGATDEVRILALQGDWGLVQATGPAGGRYVVKDPGRAHQVCLGFLDRVRASDAHLALVPELAIPLGTVPQILAFAQQMPRSFLFLGGIEGVTRQEYEVLLSGVGGRTQALEADAAGGYVNPLLIIVKTPSMFISCVRAKRIASLAENAGPPMAKGAGPFVTIRLGQPPLTVVPLVCSELVWPEKLWPLLQDEIPAPIDLVPVLELSEDDDFRHIGPQLHAAYTGGVLTKNARFIFVNQARQELRGGLCSVIVPPLSPAAPAFDHSRNELWQVAGIANYKGFCIPDKTGCIWSARVIPAHVAASALATPVCEGMVREVLEPAAAPLRGLVIGLMRTAAVTLRAGLKGVASSEARDAFLRALDRRVPENVLSSMTTVSANEVFHRIRCVEPITWPAVEGIVSELVEAAGLFATGGDPVALQPCEGGNCELAGRPVLILDAPDVDVALTHRFSLSARLEGGAIPMGVLLIDVRTAAMNFRAERIGDVLRADVVTSPSDELADSPRKAEDSAATIRIDDVEFRVLQVLKKNLSAPSLAAGRARLRELFPKVYF